MRIRKIVVGEISTNCYIAADENSGQCIIIDPGDEANRVLRFIEEERLKPAAIVITHGHYDHIGGCLELKDKLNAPLYAGKNERELLKSVNLNLAAMFGDDLVLSGDRYLNEDEILSFGDLEFRVIETPGHTPGGICLYFEKEGVLFSGDTLFYCSVGRTDLPLGDTKVLLDSLKKLAALDDEVVVYPGHGDKTSIGFERKNNPYMGE